MTLAALFAWVYVSSLHLPVLFTVELAPTAKGRETEECRTNDGQAIGGAVWHGVKGFRYFPPLPSPITPQCDNDANPTIQKLVSSPSTRNGRQRRRHVRSCDRCANMLMETQSLWRAENRRHHGDEGARARARRQLRRLGRSVLEFRLRGERVWHFAPPVFPAPPSLSPSLPISHTDHR
jgi:hypothetical protein